MNEKPIITPKNLDRVAKQRTRGEKKLRLEKALRQNLLRRKAAARPAGQKED